VNLKNNINYFPLTEFFRCLTKAGTELQANTLTTRKKKMRELILQGGDVLKFEEENRSGKTDTEVSDAFQLHGVKVYRLQSFLLCKNIVFSAQAEYS